MVRRTVNGTALILIERRLITEGEIITTRDQIYSAETFTLMLTLSMFGERSSNCFDRS